MRATGGTTQADPIELLLLRRRDCRVDSLAVGPCRKYQLSDNPAGTALACTGALNPAAWCEQKLNGSVADPGVWCCLPPVTP